MNRREYAKALAGALGFASTVLLLKAGLGLSAETIVEVTSPRIGCHPGAAQALATQRGDTVVGFALFLAANLTALVLWLFPPEEVTVPPLPPPRRLLIAAGFAFVVVLGAGSLASSRVAAYTAHGVEAEWARTLGDDSCHVSES